MRYLRWAFLVILIAGAGFAIYSAYSYLRKVEENSVCAEDILPENALLVYKSNKILEDWRHLKSTSVLWENAVSSGILGALDNSLNYADSVLIESKYLEELINQRKSLISIHYDNGNPQVLFILELDVNDDYSKVLAELTRLAPKSWKRSSERIGQVDASTFTTDKNESFTIGLFHNLLIASSSAELIEACQTVSTNEAVKNTLAIAGDGFDVHGSVYLNYELLHLYLKNNFELSPLVGLIQQESAIQDIHVDAQTIQFNGVLASNDNSIIASKLKDFPNREMTIHRYIPSSVKAFTAWSLPWFENNQAHPLSSSGVSLKEFNERAMSTDQRFGSDVKYQLFSWLGDEIAVGINKSNRKFIVASVNASVVGLEEVLSDYSRAALDYEGAVLDTSRYGEFFLCDSRLPFSYNSLLGDLFTISENVWMATDGKIALICESKADLLSYLRKLNGSTLANNQQFTEQLSKYMASKSGVFAYIKPYNLELLKQYLGDDNYKYFQSKEDFVKNIGFIGYQLVKNNDNYSQNITLAYQSTASKSESKSLWELPFSNGIISQAIPIYNHRSKATNFIVQDSLFKIHLISATGKLVWSKQLDGKLIGDITQVDIYKNEKLQMICNTKSSLYGIDILGRDLKNFPVKLSKPAHLGHLVFDYENNHDYRIIVPAGGNLLNYSTDGEKVKGWEFEAMDAAIASKPKHFVIEGKDIIVSSDVNGTMVYLNRKGERLEDLGAVITTTRANISGEIYFERSNELITSKIIYLDTNHHVISTYLGGTRDSLYIAGKDQLKRIKYVDVNGDESKDYVVFSESKVWAFNKDKTPIITIHCPDAVKSELYTFKDKITYSFITSDNTLHLYNKNGDKILELGKVPVLPIIGDFNGDGKPELVVYGEDGVLRAIDQ